MLALCSDEDEEVGPQSIPKSKTEAKELKKNYQPTPFVSNSKQQNVSIDKRESVAGPRKSAPSAFAATSRRRGPPKKAVQEQTRTLDLATKEKEEFSGFNIWLDLKAGLETVSIEI